MYELKGICVTNKKRIWLNGGEGKKMLCTDRFHFIPYMPWGEWFCICCDISCCCCCCFFHICHLSLSVLCWSLLSICWLVENGKLTTANKNAHTQREEIPHTERIIEPFLRLPQFLALLFSLTLANACNKFCHDRDRNVAISLLSVIWHIHDYTQRVTLHTPIVHRAPHNLPCLHSSSMSAFYSFSSSSSFLSIAIEIADLCQHCYYLFDVICCCCYAVFIFCLCLHGTAMQFHFHWSFMLVYLIIWSISI